VAAASAAATGAQTTAGIGTARAGRASYVPTEHLAGVPDPGAEAIAVALRAMAAARET
jgi:dihydroxyacetone kinase